MIRQTTQGCETAVDTAFEKCEWETLTYAKKNQLLFLRQKQLLNMFLERNAISKAQYEKSLTDLTLKMGPSVEAIKEE